MLTKLNNRRAGFTLVEIMIVVAIIALLAAIAVPSAIRARQRSQATDSVETCRVLDSCIDQWAIENGKKGTDTVVLADLASYVKDGTKIYKDIKDGAVLDALGTAVTVTTVNTGPKIAASTITELDEVVGKDATARAKFWGAFKP
jgi:prepilin-type N-terminal cleavage/methylation domain-containing protein